ncbi:MAG: BlaB/IND/MUS family subclass B1 metallo-beta-lactamase [Bacteroidota bacterium]
MHLTIRLLFLLLLPTALLGQTPKPALQITPLQPDFYIYTTYMTYKGEPTPANGMYVVTNAGVVLIDAPWDTTQFQPLLDSIQARHGKKVVMDIATHSHGDRTGGFNYYKTKGIKTWSSARTRTICHTNKDPEADFTFARDTVFQLGQYTFEATFAGEGHTVDNIVVWFPNEKVLYGGCLVKCMEAEDLGYIKEANLKAWPKTIRRLQKRYKNPRFIIPGHGDWRSGESLRHTLKLLKERG